MADALAELFAERRKGKEAQASSIIKTHGILQPGSSSNIRAGRNPNPQLHALTQALDHARRALPAANTHGDQAVAPAAPLQLVQDLHRQLGARAAEWVA
jgi:hypothetical protein